MASEAFISEVARLTDGYAPNPATLETLRTYRMTTVSGPAGAGKDTVMQETGLHVVKSRTSRSYEDRDSPDSYHFIIDSSDEDLVISALKAGTMVQAVSHPTTGHFYGTTLEDYGPPGNAVLMAVIPKQYYDFKNEALFGCLTAAYIAPPNYRTWQTRLAKRGGLADRADYQKRMREARDSLEVALDDGDFHFILNNHLPFAAKALHLYALTGQRYLPNEEGRLAARDMLAGLKAHNRE